VNAALATARACASAHAPFDEAYELLWSRRRIANELAKLGRCVDKDTVAKYMPKPPERPRCPPSQTWKTFVRNHLAGTIAIDFLTVSTVTFDIGAEIVPERLIRDRDAIFGTEFDE